MRLAALCAALALFAPAAGARPRARTLHKRAQRGVDPSRWFATRAGLIRVYQVKNKKSGDDPAGASCEVVDSTPAEGEASPRTRELCTMIVGKKPRSPTQLTYELRQNGIFLVRAEPQGGKPSTAEHMLLPGPLHAGQSWSEPARAGTLQRKVKSAGQPCKAAGFKFGDCLVIIATQKSGRRVASKFTETYAAGVGLVENATWQLVDLKGL